MSTVGDRRTVLGWTVAATMTPLLATRVGAAVGTRPNYFAPHTQPMTFTRRLERGLSGGARLVVTRSFTVRFAPSAQGWLVAGEQADVSVDAPEPIAQLAELERRRVETGLFPLTLDRSGLIVGGPDLRPAKELDQAVAIVRRELAKRAFSTDERAKLEAFVRTVHEAGGKMTSLPPDDLFAPRDIATHAERELALPDGATGAIEVSFRAETDPATGLMRQARREIVTTIVDDRRLTREDWTLAAI